MIVVDSNIFIAFSLVDEPLHTQANHLLATWKNAHVELIAPHLLKSEITAVMRKVVYQSRMTHEDGHLILTRLLRYSVTFYEDDDLLKDAYELAYQLNRPRDYDTQYLALSERFQCDFWTSDQTFYNVVKDNFPRVKWLGNWKMS